MYLAFEEYKELGYSDIENDAEFSFLQQLASDTLDFETMAFYKKNVLETDSFLFRKTQFKKAVASQIHYMQESGLTSSETLANMPKSVSLGRTSISLGDNSGGSGTGAKSLLTSDSRQLLTHTGLLYKGVGWRL